MVTKTIDACLFIKTLEIGRQMENNYRQIIFDCSGFGEDIAEITLVHQRSEDEAPYIVTTSAGETLTWNISDTDTAYAGMGQAELRIIFASGLAKSIVYATHVIESITGDTVIPSALQSWYDAMIDYIDEHSISPEDIAQAVEDYMIEHPIQAPVQSVNSKTGAVILTAADVGALPDSTEIPTKTSDLQNDSGFITSAPVDSVNGKTGNVVLTASDVGALPDDTIIPTRTSQLQNDSGFITSVPVTSVNSKTGAVVLDASDVHALPDSTVIPTVPTNVSAFQNDAGYLTAVPSEYVTDSELQTAIAGKANTADLATVATSGDYADLSNKPTIPTVPSNVSAFNNDAGYINASQAPVQSVNGQTGAVTGLAEAWAVQNMTTADTAVTLTAGTFYVFPEMASLAVTVTASGMYAFRFVSGTTATTLTVTGATMPDTFTVEANKVYEVNIYQGYGVVTSWTVS